MHISSIRVLRAKAATHAWLRPAVRILLIAVLASGVIEPALAANPDPALAAKINAATFEVVIPKPTSDPLSYEKPLPLELQPYQERTDKYFSIGTAFALGHNRYVTARHVLMAVADSAAKTIALRDAGGHVYASDHIEKFSAQKDFVVFSLKQQPANDVALDTNPSPTLNSVVYAVGNALGTGVILRDGLYTSDTPEEENGRWKWIRFSAAASPGNSGGPLLDQQGNIIGVVLMKSQNENLNYALPIREVLNAPDNLADIDTRRGYRLDVLDDTQNETFKAQFSLPLSVGDFIAKYQKLQDEYDDQQLKALLQQRSQDLFPYGAGSKDILQNQPVIHYFPLLVGLGSNGQWQYGGGASRHIRLSANGYIDIGQVRGTMLMKLHRSDDANVSAFYNDPKQMMDMLLKGGDLFRKVGPERIKITSLGEPTTASTYTDEWQRPWKVWVWPLPHLSLQLVMLATPVPDGYALMMRIRPGSATHDSLIDLKALTRFLSVDYGGTLAQWKTFLADASLLPEALKDLHTDVGEGQSFHYRSDTFAFTIPDTMQPVGADNWLGVGVSLYAMPKDRFALESSDVQVRVNPFDSDRITIKRQLAPSSDMNEDRQRDWQKLLLKQSPYDGRPQSNSGRDVTRVINPSGSDHPAMLYTAFYRTQDPGRYGAIIANLEILLKTLVVKDP
jgi:serine protease Do